MAVVIRLSKTGMRGVRTYRIVAVDKRQKRDSMPQDLIGYYKAGGEVRIDNEKLSHWQKQGALLSQAVRKLITQGKLS